MFLLEGRANGGIATEDTDTTERRKREALRRGRTMAGNPPLMVGNTLILNVLMPPFITKPHNTFSFFPLSKSLSTLQWMFTLLRAFNCVYSSLTGLASDNKQKPLQSTIDGPSQFLLNSGILWKRVLNSTLNFYRYSLQVVMKLVVWFFSLMQWSWTLNAIRRPQNLS